MWFNGIVVCPTKHSSGASVEQILNIDAVMFAAVVAAVSLVMYIFAEMNIYLEKFYGIYIKCHSSMYPLMIALIRRKRRKQQYGALVRRLGGRKTRPLREENAKQGQNVSSRHW
jgi:hypothetical protein